MRLGRKIRLPVGGSHNFFIILLASPRTRARRGRSAFCLRFHVNYSVFFMDVVVSIRGWIRLSAGWSSLRPATFGTRAATNKRRWKRAEFCTSKRGNKETAGRGETEYRSSKEIKRPSHATGFFFEFHSVRTIELRSRLISFARSYSSIVNVGSLIMSSVKSDEVEFSLFFFFFFFLLNLGIVLRSSNKSFFIFFKASFRIWFLT